VDPDIGGFGDRVCGSVVAVMIRSLELALVATAAGGVFAVLVGRVLGFL
jgi:hypothetical protein